MNLKSSGRAQRGKTVSDGSKPEVVTQLHPVTVVLRLVVDPRGHLRYGELVDAEGRSRGHFNGWMGLTGALRGWMVEAAAER